MIALSIRFLTGRYHATQWGRHVNEGVPEWPPSPWRVLRCLIATWKTKCPEVSDELAATILGKLADSPEFALPDASLAHTRHYMPWDKNYPGHTTLVFDTFVVVPKTSEVLVYWSEAGLTTEDRSVLSKWLEHVAYLGRAESWCEMRLLPESEAVLKMSLINCRPLETRTPEQGAEIVRVLCPDPATAFQATHTPKNTVSTRKGKGKQVVVTPDYDPDWHICGETLWLHKERWAEAPGSRWVRYTRKAECFKVAPAKRPRITVAAKPQWTRFALDSTVLPLVTESLPVAEAFRRRLMGIVGRQKTQPDGTRGKSEVFSGKAVTGERLDSHGHAWFLPADEDNDGRLDHVTIVAPDGFGADELKAIRSLRGIKTNASEESGHAIGVLLLAEGRLANEANNGPVASSAVWKSATPYLCHRHPKTRGSKKDQARELGSYALFTEARLREDVSRLLQRRDDLKDISIDQIDISPLTDGNGVFRMGVRNHRPIEFQRYRQKQGDDGGKRLCGAFSITFPRPVQGPIALGHSCHYGLGLFYPDLSTSP